MNLFISAYDQAEDDVYERMEKEKDARKKEKAKNKADDRSDVNTKKKKIVVLHNFIYWHCSVRFEFCISWLPFNG